MSRFLRRSLSVLCATATVAVTLCAQPPVANPAGPGAPNGQMRGPEKPRNLKVLPEDTDLRAVMHQYTGDLGVGCGFCHAAPDPVTHRSDRASDANPVKEKARYMIQMTMDLNSKYLAQMPDRHETDPITCGTCHRGEKHPSVFVPTAQPEGNRPPGMPPASGMAPAGGPGK
jgi:hypothetical protein